MKISIITVAFNSALTIGNTINSILTQTYANIEYIIVDGASKDNTINVIKEYEPCFKGRMKWISEKDNGIYDAMNKGIKLATGEVIGILNSDDQLFNVESIEKIVNSFEINKVDAVYGNIIFTNREGKIVRKWESKPFQSGLFAKSWSPAHPTFYCKLELYRKYGLYKTYYQVAADIELMLRFMEVNKISSYYLDEVLVNMQTGGVSTQGFKSKIIITKDVIEAFKENKLPFNLPKYLYYKTLKIRELL